MPHTALHGGFDVGASAAVIGSGEFIAVTIVAVLHHEVHAAGTRAVVIIRLPHGAEGIDRYLPVVAKIVTEHLHSTAIELAANDHAFLIRFAAIVNGIPKNIPHQGTIRTPQACVKIAEVKIKPPIGPKHHGVNRVVMLSINRIQNFPCEQHLFRVCLAIAIGVGN